MDKNMELNSLVAEYCEQRKQGVSRNKIKNFNQIYKICRDRTAFYMFRENYKDVYSDAFSLAIFNALEKYDSKENTNFIYYFKTILENDMKDELKKQNRLKRELSFDKIFDGDDSDNTNKLYDKIEDTKTDDELKEKLELTGSFDLLRDWVKTKKDKTKDGKPCWSMLFFTELVVYSVSAFEKIYLHIDSNSKKYLPSISLEFINSFATSECCTIKDIVISEIRPECRSPFKNVHQYQILRNNVYEKFTGKTGVTEQRNKFEVTLKKVFIDSELS